MSSAGHSQSMADKSTDGKPMVTTTTTDTAGLVGRYQCDYQKCGKRLSTERLLQWHKYKKHSVGQASAFRSLPNTARTDTTTTSTNPTPGTSQPLAATSPPMATNTAITSDDPNPRQNQPPTEETPDPPLNSHPLSSYKLYLITSDCPTPTCGVPPTALPVLTISTDLTAISDPRVRRRLGLPVLVSQLSPITCSTTSTATIPTIPIISTYITTSTTGSTTRSTTSDHNSDINTLQNAQIDVQTTDTDVTNSDQTLNTVQNVVNSQPTNDGDCEAPNSDIQGSDGKDKTSDLLPKGRKLSDNHEKEIPPQSSPETSSHTSNGETTNSSDVEIMTIDSDDDIEIIDVIPAPNKPTNTPKTPVVCKLEVQEVSHTLDTTSNVEQNCNESLNLEDNPMVVTPGPTSPSSTATDDTLNIRDQLDKLLEDTNDSDISDTDMAEDDAIVNARADALMQRMQSLLSSQWETKPNVNELNVNQESTASDGQQPQPVAGHSSTTPSDNENQISFNAKRVKQEKQDISNTDDNQRDNTSINDSSLTSESVLPDVTNLNAGLQEVKSEPMPVSDSILSDPKNTQKKNLSPTEGIVVFDKLLDIVIHPRLSTDQPLDANNTPNDTLVSNVSVVNNTTDDREQVLDNTPEESTTCHTCDSEQPVMTSETNITDSQIVDNNQLITPDDRVSGDTSTDQSVSTKTSDNLTANTEHNDRNVTKEVVNEKNNNKKRRRIPSGDERHLPDKRSRDSMDRKSDSNDSHRRRRRETSSSRDRDTSNSRTERFVSKSTTSLPEDSSSESSDGEVSDSSGSDGRKRVTPERSYRCEKCDQEFDKLYEYNEHKYIDHGVRQLYRCPAYRCGRQFILSSDCVRHQRREHRQYRRVPYECEYADCRRQFKHRRHVSRHVKSRHSSKPMFVCNVDDCHREFTKETNYYHHKRNDHRIYRTNAHKCDYKGCRRVCGTKQSLMNHKRVDHPGLYRYACDYRDCTSRYLTMASLDQHKATKHTELLCKHECNYPDCFGRFSSKDILIKHWNSVHRPTAELSTSGLISKSSDSQLATERPPETPSPSISESLYTKITTTNKVSEPSDSEDNRSDGDLIVKSRSHRYYRRSSRDAIVKYSDSSETDFLATPVKTGSQMPDKDITSHTITATITKPIPTVAIPFISDEPEPNITSNSDQHMRDNSDGHQSLEPIQSIQSNSNVINDTIPGFTSPAESPAITPDNPNGFWEKRYKMLTNSEPIIPTIKRPNIPLKDISGLKSNTKATAKSATISNQSMGSVDSDPKSSQPKSKPLNPITSTKPSVGNLKPTGDSQPFKCYYKKCSKNFETETDLNKHRFAMHDIPYPYVCHIKTCNNRFTTISLLESHKQFFHDLLPQELGTNDNNLQIFEVSTSEPSSQELATTDDDNNNDTKDLPFKCQQCGKAYEQESQVRDHKLAVHYPELRPYVCRRDGCSERFSSEWLVKMHWKTAHPSKSNQYIYKCDDKACVVERGFANETQLNEHKLKIHGQPYPYRCEHRECGQSFAGMAALNVHKQCHELIDHSNKPDGVRPDCKYICGYKSKGCRERYATWDALRTHKKICKVVNEKESIQTRKRVPECFKCGNKYDSTYDLYEHIRRRGHSLTYDEKQKHLRRFRDEETDTDSIGTDSTDQTCSNPIVPNNDRPVANTSKNSDTLADNTSMAAKPDSTQSVMTRKNSTTNSDSNDLNNTDEIVDETIDTTCMATESSDNTMPSPVSTPIEAIVLVPEPVPVLDTQTPDTNHIDSNDSYDVVDEWTPPETSCAANNTETIAQTFKCQECDLEFGSDDDLRQHTSAVHSALPYPCGDSGCGQAFITQWALDLHKQSEHQVSQNESDLNTSTVTTGPKSGSTKQSFQCDECQKCFQLRFSLNKHKTTVHSGHSLAADRRESSDCEVLFDSSIADTQSPQTLANTSNIPSNADDLTTEPTVSCDLSFTCDKCDAVFDGLSHLIEHQSAVHSGVHTYRCDDNTDCQQVFSNQSDLDSHKRDTHLSQSSSNSITSSHIPSSSGVSTTGAQQSIQQQYKCNKCDKTYNYEYNYNEHRFGLHQIPLPYVCDHNMCGKGFGSERALNIHKRDLKSYESLNSTLKSYLIL